ncbi:acyl-ACP desaturase [Oceanibaculum pacificum]|uniref:Rubrerythrin family protein n=1 Tax=Oceanibaculum pacificum TaxID=580166 RepID=A0A154W4B0_9PROT|nr:ferritin-like domain-containing protein [Oceanibaculum pacificum]KZD08376.1 rubrerythrin family protein [Oceanibaculum pacificum]
MAHWTLDDIDWARFEPGKIDPEIVSIVKAASMVEHNGGVYGDYLCNVFHDDEAFKAVARSWALEEVQHGVALRRWAEMADPTFDFESSFKRFADTIKLPMDADRSVRGSLSGELVARCVVEIGTSSYYSALADSTDEPVLKDICQRIAADELRHYKLFYSHLKRYQEIEKLGVLRRFAIAASRVAESEDDELAFAYYAANDNGQGGAYDRDRCCQAYQQRAFRYYRPHHVERGMAMMFKAVGLKPNGPLNRAVNRIAWWLITRKAAQAEKAAA